MKITDLTEHDCYRIVKAWQSGITLESIAAAYECDVSMIQQVIDAYGKMGVENG